MPLPVHVLPAVPPSSAAGRSRPWARPLVLATAWALAGALGAQDVSWIEPSATLDLFPLDVVSLAYQPASARILEAGAWEVGLQAARSNTFEFSPRLKAELERPEPGRLHLDRASAEAYPSAHPDEPLAFYFDGEVQRTELKVRRGLGRDFEVGLALRWQSMGGGFLDGPIERFHDLGFAQTGRTRVARDDLHLILIRSGRVVGFQDQGCRARPMDPLLTLRGRLWSRDRTRVALQAQVQVPVTRGWEGFREAMDACLALLAETPAGPGTLQGGLARVHRRLLTRGADFPPIRSQWAGHLGWTWEGAGSWHPYLQVLARTGLTQGHPGTRTDRPAVLHDLGCHWALTPRTAITFSYVNNITHNENTADVGFQLRVSWRS